MPEKLNRGYLEIMRIEKTDEFEKKLRKLVRRNRKLKLLVDRKLGLLLMPEKPAGLRLHKIESAGIDLWSISININLRIMFTYAKESVILLIEIGSHDEVY